MRYRAVLFDLFRTVILFDDQAPSNRVTEPTWRAAMSPLRPALAAVAPELDFDCFLDSLVEVTTELNRRRAPEYVELPCEERYRRACERLGMKGPSVAAVAEHGVRLQMAQLKAHARMLDESRRFLHELAVECPIGVVSNFDHAETIHSLLAQHGLTKLFAATLISIEVGRRKPHRAIFAAALQRLEVQPDEALFVGDSLFEDVGGAQAAGLDAIWINAAGDPLPAGGPTPKGIIAQLTELRRFLS